MRNLILIALLALAVWWLFTKAGFFVSQLAPPAPSRAALVAGAGGAGGSASAPSQPVGAAAASPAPAQPFGAAPAALTPVRPGLPTPRISLRPVFERACAQCKVQLVEYKEPMAGIVEFTVKGLDRNSVSDVVDILVWPKGTVIKDIFLDAKHPQAKQSYWMTLENSRQFHYAYYKVRVLP